MSNILLVEPAYRSKFPPLGLLKISTYHKKRGDSVTFVRGCVERCRQAQWHRIYVSSLFTWELPRTAKTIRYYKPAVASPRDIFVGGVGATLLPEYLQKHAECSVITGTLDRPNLLGPKSEGISRLVPDYSLLDKSDYGYSPRDCYFAKITEGCIRKCAFCAVPKLETRFGVLTEIKRHVRQVDRLFGEKQNLVVMDNNTLGIPDIEKILTEIKGIGFERGAKRNGRKRTVDFNQGLDARLISRNPRLAELLGQICLSPVRLAFDRMEHEKQYRRAIELLVAQGVHEFTNYMLFNFEDTPEDLYRRLMINAELNEKFKVRITGFPMRFIPMDQVTRDYVAPKWNWRLLRGIQCVLLATRGLASPNPQFLRRAFGSTFEEFLRILSMPDRYIIYREEYEKTGETEEWRNQFDKLSERSRFEFLEILRDLHADRKRKPRILSMRRYRKLLEHYYPGGESPSTKPPEEQLARQGISVGQC